MEISVIIPVYNAAQYLEQAVDSALAQPETAEVLLIEDGSPDDSLAVCRRLSQEHDRVRLFTHPNWENRGAGESRNVGLRNARCPYIAFLDADDYYLPRRFAAAGKLFDEDTDIDGVYEAVGNHYEDENMRRWWQRRHPASELTTLLERIRPESLFAELLLGVKGWFCTDGIVVRRELFTRTGEFDTQLRMCQDTAMWLKMAMVGRLVGGVLDQPIAMRRLHGNNRIVRDSHLHSGYGAMMYSELMRWTHAQRLDRKYLAMLLPIHLRQGMNARASIRPIVARKITQVRFLANAVRMCPFAVRTTALREQLLVLMGWRGVLRRYRKFSGI